MEKAAIITLLEKYWRAETTIEEEKALADWFNAQAPDTLDPDLEPYSALFAYFDEEAQVHPAPGFEDRLLAAITAVPAADGTIHRTTGISTHPATGTATYIRPFRLGLLSAAATLLILVASLFLFQPTKNNLQPNGVAGQSIDPVKTTSSAASQPAVAAANIKDTYHDPEQALAAVRHALLIASAHLNEGRKQILNK
jgi:hypothetical protein